MNSFRLALIKLILWLYRWAAVVVLYSFFAILVGYVLYWSFALLSNSWTVPITLSRSDAASLDMLGKVLTSRAQLEALSIDCQKQDLLVVEMKMHETALEKIDRQIDGAISREATAAAMNGNDLTNLYARKFRNNVANDKVGTTAVRGQISQDLAAGLITKADAEVARLALTEAENAFTDSAISTVLLRDQIVEHAPAATKTLETVSKRAELKSELLQLAVNIETAEMTLLAEKGQISELKQALAAAAENPVYSVLFGNPKTFLFVPYGTDMHVGSAVYRCVAGLFDCSQVGHVTNLYAGEIHEQGTQFRDNVVGTMAEVELSNPEAAKSKVLFFGRPLWIF